MEVMADSQYSHQVVVREVVCKSILNRSTLGDYSLNCYTGCAHACVYCYARFMQRFHPHDELWGQFVDVKVNALEVLKRQLRRAEPGEVFMSSACDGWQAEERHRRLTRRCCELLVERDFGLRILTKSDLVLRDLDVLAGHDVQVGVTVTTLDERLRKLWEPEASPVENRWRVLAEARRAGLKTSVMLGPLLPWMSDDEASIEAMLARAKELEVERIWVDAMNPRPRVWPAVAELLRENFSAVVDDYRRILFDQKARETYLAALRERVSSAARRLGLGKRVQACLGEGIGD